MIFYTVCEVVLMKLRLGLGKAFANDFVTWPEDECV